MTTEFRCSIMAKIKPNIRSEGLLIAFAFIIHAAILVEAR